MTPEREQETDYSAIADAAYDDMRIMDAYGPDEIRALLIELSSLRGRVEQAEKALQASGAAFEKVQELLCAWGMPDRARHNRIAGVVHDVLLDYFGGYTSEAIVARAAVSTAPEEQP